MRILPRIGHLHANWYSSMMKHTSGSGKYNLFREDVVESASKPGLLGLVLKYDRDSDPTSADVLWLNARAAVPTNVTDLLVRDRALQHSDWVRWASTPAGQSEMGRVLDTSLLVDVQMVETGVVCRGVDSKAIRRMTSVNVDDVVVRGSWVGKVLDLVDINVTVRYEDGTRCVVMHAHPFWLAPVPVPSGDAWHYYIAESDLEFYPGQKVQATSADAFLDAAWTPRPSDSPLDVATVVEVEVAGVLVTWMRHRHTIDATGAGNSSKFRRPEMEQRVQDLAVLDPFVHGDWGMGDCCRYTPPPATGGTAGAARIVNVSTKADVVWQTGDTSSGVDSRLLARVPQAKGKAMNFWPGDRVADAATKNGAGGGAPTGIVRWVGAEQRKAVVKWFKAGVARARARGEELVCVHRIAGQECLVSHYTGSVSTCRRESGDLGDVVLRIPPARESGKGQQWVGTILRFTIDGDVEVVWQDGSIFCVKPWEVTLCDGEEDGANHDSENRYPESSSGSDYESESWPEDEVDD